MHLDLNGTFCPTAEVFQKEGQRLTIIGRSGSGKTNTLLVIAQELAAAGIPFTFIDPNRQADRLKDDLPVLHVGRRALSHFEITVDNAAELGRLCARDRLCAVLDLSWYKDTDTNPERQTVLAAYLDALWDVQFRTEPAQPYVLLIDEAHEFAPQTTVTPTSELLIDIAKRGRFTGLSLLVATQRPASLTKDVFNQTSAFVLHSVWATHDVAPFAKMTPFSDKELLSKVKKAPRGQALVIGTEEWIGGEEYLTVQIRPAFTSSENAQPVIRSSPLRPIDPAMFEALKMSSAPISEADQLRQQIRQLQEAQAREREAHAARVAELEAQAEQMRSQIEMLSAFKLSVEMQLPTILQTERIEAAQLVTSLPSSASAPVAAPVNSAHAQASAAPVAAPVDPEAPYRTPIADERARRHQQKVFDGLMATVRGTPPSHRRVLALLAKHPTSTFNENEMARFIGVSSTTLAKHRPKNLAELGLIEYQNVYGKWTYSLVGRHVLQKKFPDLDVDRLIDTMKRMG
jgi:hypothetical protein